MKQELSNTELKRSNHLNLSATSMVVDVRTAAMARSHAAALVVGGMFAVVALAACQPQRASVSRSLDAGVPPSAAPQATDASFDAQLRLDPGEIQSYTQNIHG